MQHFSVWKFWVLCLCVIGTAFPVCAGPRERDRKAL